MNKGLKINLVLVSGVVGVSLLLNAEENKNFSKICNKTFYKSLRLHHKYRFSDVFNNENSYDKKLKRVIVDFSEKYDYDGENSNPQFGYTSTIKEKKGVIKAHSSERIVETNDYYHIKYRPQHRINDAIKINYKVYYTKYVNGKRVGDVLNHTECVNYAITWCGDGVIDSQYGEECDPGDPTHKNWGNKGCSSECKPINGPKCDETFNFVLRKGKSYLFSDELYNPKSNKIKLKQYKVVFDEQYNLNGSLSSPKFKASDWIKQKGYVMNGKEKGVVIDTQPGTDYKIIYNPSKRSYDNLKILYNISYSNLVNGDEIGYYYHTYCVNYAVSWCGDGVVDSQYGEECDPKDSKKQNWSKKGCNSKTCKPIK